MGILNRSVVGFLVFAISICLGALLAFSAGSVLQMHTFGDKTSVLLPLLVGIPLGCVFGSAVNLKISKLKVHQNLCILVAPAVVGIFGAMLCVLLADVLGGNVLLLSPLVVLFLSYGAFCLLVHCGI
jgi:hypothetical protein